jgi:hypothetical protein
MKTFEGKEAVMEQITLMDEVRPGETMDAVFQSFDDERRQLARSARARTRRSMAIP